MKQNMNRLYILLLLCVFTSCLYSQTKLVSSRYQLERVSIGKDADKKERYAYHLIDDYHAFQKQISDKHLKRMSADHPVFLSRDAEKTFGKSILGILDRELSNREKERLDKNKHWIFVTMSIDGTGKLLFVELLSSGWMMEEEINAKHISNILHQIKRIPINNIRPFQENGYIRYTVVRRRWGMGAL